jgi:hypothetical protein
LDVRQHHEALTRYVAAIEDAARPALRARWMDTSTLLVTGAAPPGHLVAVQVNADPGWRATQDGHEVPITQDKLGFVVLHPTPAATTQIELRFQGTLEQRIMAALCALAWIASLFAWWGRRFRLPSLPTRHA